MTPDQIINAADAQANLGFVLSQTAHIETEVNRVQYPEIMFPQLITVDRSAHPFAKTVTYFSSDIAGQPKVINGNSGGDIPLVSANQTEHNESVHMHALGYGYGWEEMGQARMLRRNLSAEGAKDAREVFMQYVDGLVMLGSTETGAKGLINSSTVSLTVLLASAANAASTKFVDKTTTEILRDLNSLLTEVNDASLGVEMANTMLLPIATFNYLAATPYSSLSDKTILDFFIANNVYTATTRLPLNIRALNRLNTAGAGGSRRIVAYNNSSKVVKFHMPMPHQFLPAQIDGLNVIVPGVARMAGVDWRRPGAARYADGV